MTDSRGVRGAGGPKAPGGATGGRRGMRRPDSDYPKPATHAGGEQEQMGAMETERLVLEEVVPALESLMVLWSRAQEALGTAVSPAQMRALSVVSAQEGLNLGALAEALGTIPSVASRLCDRLQAAGLIEREVEPTNRRQVTLRLARHGRLLLESLRVERARQLSEVLAAMAPHDRAAFVQGLLAFEGAAGPAEESAARREPA
ncbi:MarR family winged helix-turn-helix transcriptional regulator [Streptomyces sp. NPDC059637]|uniref:MarR family winged helix-turn-helix transcriptional regulator n=1 Tax=Streptomyces sp. NPDC059637 TaxID=3347752 RepID=UPI0036C8C203